jgi:dolichol-phosphate mannosyltransferase
MAKNNYTAEQITGVLKRMDAGQKVPDLARELGVSETTLYTWKSGDGGLEANQARHPRELERQRGESRMLVAELRPERQALELALVIPTFNERENILPLIEVIERDLAGVSWEVIFVDDDSPDGTADFIRSLSQQNPAIRVVQRIGRRGLSSACIEGMMATSAPFVAVMDADLQHDSRLLRPMLDALRDRNFDMACGSRYMKGGDFGEWAGTRQWMSRFATWICLNFLKVNLTDPMSGFFMLRREYLDQAVRNLSTQGFKVFLDLVTATKSQAKVVELPFRFGTRLRGESKLDSLVIVEFGLMLIERRLPAIPFRFLEFVLAGSVGGLAHLAVLGATLSVTAWPFYKAQALATVVAMTVNFVMNNLLTYRQNKLKGWRFVRGLLSFYIACSLGAMANLAVAQNVYDFGVPWWLAGLAGAALGSVWNYAVTSIFTWGSRRK